MNTDKQTFSVSFLVLSVFICVYLWPYAFYDVRVLLSARVLVCNALGAAALLAQPADAIFRNGKIVTVDPEFRVTDSLAIRGDRIVAVGARAEVAKLAGPGTREVDLKGKTVLPGLTDSHVHAAEAALYEFDHAVADMETIADVLAYIR